MKTKLHTFDKLILSIDMLSINLSDKIKCQLRFQRIAYKMNENERKRLSSCCYYIRFRDHMGIRRRSNPLLEPVSNESAAMGSPFEFDTFLIFFSLTRTNRYYIAAILSSPSFVPLCARHLHIHIYIHKNTHTHTHLFLWLIVKCKFLSFYFCCFFSSPLYAFPFPSSVFPMFSVIFIFILMIIVFFRTTCQSRRRNRTKEEVECNQSPICIYLLQSLVPRSLLRYFGGISIFLYESYRARVLDIRKHVSEQMIERLRKRKMNTRMLGNWSEGKKRFFPMKGNEFSRDLYNAIGQTQSMFIKRKKILMKLKRRLYIRECRFTTNKGYEIIKTSLVNVTRVIRGRVSR